MAISPQQLTIYLGLYSAHRAVIFAIAQLSCLVADGTNSRAYATVLRLSSVTLCIVAKRCVLEQKLLFTAYRKSYTRNRLVPK